MNTVVCTRDSLDALEHEYWDDPDGVEAQAYALLDTATDGAIPDSHRHRLLLLIAAVRSRRGENESAAAQVNESRQWAVVHDDVDVRVRCERLLASIFDRMGDASLALEHAVTANALVCATDTLSTRAAVRLSLADALGSAGSQDEARGHYDKADELAQRAGASRLHALILNNRAYSEHLTGHPQHAQRDADRLLEVLADNGDEPAAYIRDTLAAIWMEAGRFDDAEQILSPYVHAGSDEADVHGVAAALLTLACILRRKGDLPAAADALERCRCLCAAASLPGTEHEAEREQAELHAARGDFRSAYEVFILFHEHSEQMRAAQREARSRVLHVLFETDEARRDREMYRSLSERDPLTDLPNRRHVDGTLSDLIAGAGDGGSLALGFVDLDHFKVVNDTLSHQVGDTVLVEIARILTRIAGEHPGAFAARMGGEEFLVALPGVTHDQASAAFEDIRHRIAEHDWRPFTGALRITASIGAALAPADGRERVSLLHLADSRLYAAKNAGRNRVAFSQQQPGSVSATNEPRSTAVA